MINIRYVTGPQLGLELGEGGKNKKEVVGLSGLMVHVDDGGSLIVKDRSPSPQIDPV